MSNVLEQSAGTRTLPTSSSDLTRRTTGPSESRLQYRRGVFNFFVVVLTGAEPDFADGRAGSTAGVVSRVVDTPASA
jgi:hypothetical protein